MSNGQEQQGSLFGLFGLEEPTPVGQDTSVVQPTDTTATESTSQDSNLFSLFGLDNPVPVVEEVIEEEDKKSEEEYALEVLNVDTTPKDPQDTVEEHALKTEIINLTTPSVFGESDAYSKSLGLNLGYKYGGEDDEQKTYAHNEVNVEASAPDEFDPESDKFDLKSAIEAGDKPDETGHWGSIGKDGLVLKGRQHPTWDEMEMAELALGNRVVKRDDGRYVSESILKELEEYSSRDEDEQTTAEKMAEDPRFGYKSFGQGIGVKASFEEVVAFKDKLNIPYSDAERNILHSGLKPYLEAPEGVTAESIDLNYAKSRYELSKAPKQDDWDKFVNFVHNHVAPPLTDVVSLGMVDGKPSYPEEDSITAGIANTITGAAEFGVGMAEFATAAGDLIFKAEWKPFVHMTGGLIQAMVEEPANLLVAAGLNPLPQYNKYLPEGQKAIREAQMRIWRNPLAPLAFSLGMGHIPRQFVGVRNGMAKVVNKADVAIQYLRDPHNPKLKITPEIKKLAEDLNGGPLKFKVAVEDAVVKTKQMELNFQESQKSPSKKAKKGKKTKKDATPLDKPLPENVPQPSKGAVKKYETWEKNRHEKMREKALESEMDALIEAKESAQKRLETETNLTSNQKASLESTIKKADTLIIQNAQKMADLGINPIHYFQMSFGLTEGMAKAAWQRVLKGADFLVGKAKNNFHWKMTDPVHWSAGNPFFSEEMTQLQRAFNWQDNKMNRLAQKDSKVLDRFMRSWVDINWDVRKAILRSDAPWPYINEALMELDLVRGASGKTAWEVKKAIKKINKGLKESDIRLLDRIIQARREVQIYKRNAEKIPQWQAELKASKNKKEQTKLKKKIKEAENYEYSLSEIIDESTGKRVRDETGAIMKRSPEEQVVLYEKFQEGMKIERKDLWDKSTDVFDLYKENLKEMHENGLFTDKEFGELDLYLYQRKQYLERYKENISKHMEAGGKISIIDNGLKSLKSGSPGGLMNDWVTLLEDNMSMKNNHIFKNNANRALAEFIEISPENGLGKLLKQNERVPVGHSAIDYIDKGKKKRIAMETELFESWGKSDPLLNSNLANTISWASGTKILKATATGYNPTFAFVNMPRDMAYMWLTTSHYSPTMGIAIGQMARDYAATAKDAIMRKGRHNDYMMEGGGMSFLSQQGHVGRKAFGKRVPQWMEKVKTAMGYIGETSEIWTRLALRERAMRSPTEGFQGGMGFGGSGFSAKQATHAARNYLDFAQGGNWSKWMDTSFPYMNARIQASRGLFRAAHQRPAQMTYKAGQIATVTTGLWMANNYLSGDYKNYISPGQYYNNHIMILPGTEYKDEKGHTRRLFIKFPKDDAQKAIGGVMDSMMEYTFGNKEDADSIMELVWKTLGSVSPAGISSIPPAISIAAGTLLNMDIKAGYDLNSVNKAVDDRFQASLNEKEYVLDIADSWNNSILGEINEVSPTTIDFNIKQLVADGNWFAGMGSQAYTMMKESAGEEMKQLPNDRVDFTKILGLKQVSKRFFGYTGTKNYSVAKDVRRFEETVLTRREKGNQKLKYLASDIVKGVAGSDTALANFMDEQTDPNERKRFEKRAIDMVRKGYTTTGNAFIDEHQNKTPIVKAYAILGWLETMEGDVDKRLDFMADLEFAKFPTKRTMESLLLMYQGKKYEDFWIKSYGEESYNLLLKRLNRIEGSPD